MPNFAILKGESRHESSAKQQQAAMFVSDILEKLALSPPRSLSLVACSLTKNRDATNVCFVKLDEDQEDCNFVVPRDRDGCDSLKISADINVMLNKGCGSKEAPPFVTLAIIAAPPRERPFCSCGLSTLAFE
ncbi:unnamed protein product [Porites evermanni]|uniref:Uncharacterized protein n=1 Tax=Porites evermanni TaxID=104178 RepID=A0ABN8QDL2_9CNID|nr:unnamed protein product [Porites evermanni]